MVTVSQREVILPPLHDSQRAIAKHEARFKVVCCGRRYGKTMLAMVVELRAALKGQRVWHLAPTYQQGQEGWSYLMRLVNQLPKDMWSLRVSDKAVRFTGGGEIQIKTADNPNNLRGSGLDGAVFDEAAVINPEVWDLIIRPALVDRGGWALFISTPQHFNWFHDLYQRGQEGNDEWASWQYPTWNNPYIPEAEIESAQRDMAPEDFDQEFGASFTAVGGAIFRTLGPGTHLHLRPMPSGLSLGRTGVGMDWGTTPQHQAAVVCASACKTGEIWVRSAWLSPTGSDDAWIREAERCRHDYQATVARYDRSQGAVKDRLTALGFDAKPGNAQPESRIGAYNGLISRRVLFFDINGPGVKEYYRHLCMYHRDKDGKVVEEEDDDVDAGGYVISELVNPAPEPLTSSRRPQQPTRPNRRPEFHSI